MDSTRPFTGLATWPPRSGSAMLVRSSWFRRCSRTCAWPRSARSPATHPRPSFWKGARPRFSGPEPRRSTSATPTSTRGHTRRTDRPRSSCDVYDLRTRCRVVSSRKQPAASRAIHREALTSRAALAAKERVGREARAKGSPERAPLLVSSRAPVSPARRRAGAGGSRRLDDRPWISVRRRSAKSDAFDEIEVLSAASEPEHAHQAYAPARVRTVPLLTPPIRACA